MMLRHEVDPAGAAGISGHPDFLPPQVLVVDDSTLVRGLILRLLHRAGYRAVAVDNGASAKAFLGAAKPFLVISDLQMPGSDGWDLLAFCHDHHPEVPVLILSGRAQGQRREIERWAAGFLPKPFDARELRAEVDRLVSRAMSDASAPGPAGPLPPASAA